MNPSSGSRRPIKTRDAAWPRTLAAALARAGASPNGISIASVAWAALAAAAFAAAPMQSPLLSALCFVGAAAGVQLRLLCNLLDGLVAVEGGRRTKSGDVFNELPDRFADALILIGAGYAARGGAGGVELGWAAAVLAVITAYVRALGASLGAGHCFFGPMAKPHRMAAITAGAVLAALAAGAGFPEIAACVLVAALAVIALGSAITIGRRTRWVIRALESPR